VDKIIVQGGRQLEGEVAVSGSKNAALPILISSLFTSETCIYQGTPIVDINTILKLLGGLGVDVDKDSWPETRVISRFGRNG
jgi:UDP-N-acetylglucosamine 1-carboxyvinyltransferase